MTRGWGLELALLLLYVVRLVMDRVELTPDRLQELRGIIRGFGQLAEIVLQVVDALAAARERRVRAAGCQSRAVTQ